MNNKSNIAVQNWSRGKCERPIDKEDDKGQHNTTEGALEGEFTDPLGLNRKQSGSSGMVAPCDSRMKCCKFGGSVAE